MKICYLADINSANTKKICNYFISKGNEVYVISLHNRELDRVNVNNLEVDPSLVKLQKSTGKLGHLNKIKSIKEAIFYYSQMKD